MKAMERLLVYVMGDKSEPLLPLIKTLMDNKFIHKKVKITPPPSLKNHRGP